MLNSISPIDGRYASKTDELKEYFSEYALIKARVYVEVQYFLHLYRYGIRELQSFPAAVLENLEKVASGFTIENAQEIKEIEKITNHDVKAVEYWIKDRFEELGVGEYKEFVHFALTSQDINNTAIPYLLKQACVKEYIPLIEEVTNAIEKLARSNSSIPMLARTHGQPASPTRFGKEMQVFVERLRNQRNLLHKIQVFAKFGGATGNFNAHHVAYPDIDWKEFADSFVNRRLRLQRLQYTTQIEHYDNLAALFHNFMRYNTILIDFCRDIWTYISMNYIKQKTVEGEVGSSAMPHKVNPIDFENAEGNLGLANAIYAHLADKLPISRLQRDLTDSTVSRNFGVPIAHSMIALKSILKGLSKVSVNPSAMLSDLHQHWNVLAEPIQNVLRKIGYPEPYETLKELTRGADDISEEKLHNFIDSLDIEEKLKNELKELRPENYVGI